MFLKKFLLTIYNLHNFVFTIKYTDLYSPNPNCVKQFLIIFSQLCIPYGICLLMKNKPCKLTA